MLVYLANKYPDKGLLPADARGKADVARWMFWNASHLEASVFTVAFEKVVKPMMMGQQPDEARVAAGTAEWERFAPILDAHLAGKDWLCGKQFTIADICLGATADFAGMAGLDLGKLRNITTWLGRLRERASWKA
jgi:glutathione S-transferase